MKIFLSANEDTLTFTDGTKHDVARYIVDNGVKMKWNLMSFYYIRRKLSLADFIRDNSELVLIDSGAHSFQFGKKVDFEQYTHEYADFIKQYDRDNVLGYFEMDIENVIGMERVLELRKILEEASDKIIPVWHRNRGIKNYYEMCEQYAGKVIAIGGFRGTDIRDDQYLSFLKVAKKYNCKVHCLGMTRVDVLGKIPFDFTDSATWHTATDYGRPYHNFNESGTTKFPKAKKEEKAKQYLYNYKRAIEMQEHFYNKWKSVCND